MMDIRSKKEELRMAIEEKDAFKIASIFSLGATGLKRHHHGNRKNKQQKAKGVHNKSTFSLEAGEQDWSKVFTFMYEVNKAAKGGDFISCYQSQSALHSNFHQLLSASRGNWLIPTLHVICKNTHQIALLADEAIIAINTLNNNKKQKMNNGDAYGSSVISGGGSGGGSNAKLQNAVTLLQESYSKTFNDRKEYKVDEESAKTTTTVYDEDGSKKAGVLTIVNELFSMYFFLNTLRLCKSLTGPIESRKLHTMGDLGPKITYRYYVGRLHLFEDQYSLAGQHLDYALRHCPPSAIKNRRCILRYLIPVKLVHGRLPSTQLLKKYQLQEFVPIVQGMKQGDLRTFHDGLVRYQDLFIRLGTYLLLEKCKTVCYRNLLKRIHYILSGGGGGTSTTTTVHQIKLKDVAIVLKWLGIPIDLDEVECILANLIFRGYVRGYLSHAKRILVLSKRDPFPISAVIIGTVKTTKATTTGDATMKG